MEAHGTQERLQVHIRWLIRRDLPEVLAIEKESFEFPWSEAEFADCLSRRNCVGMVAQHGQRIVGYMIYELGKTRIHLLNLAVAPSYRRRGVGSQMIAKLISKLAPEQREKIFLEVRESNLVAQLFFRANGFRATSVLRNFYEDSPEDAYLMEYALSSAAPPAVITGVNRIARYLNRTEGA
ncbi:MAG: ribosomal protein S18-alanine N-acetyltransferase [Thermoguttaceae bacterium]|nr:ribosomal protein S18-alanine N-acetyltransferase [Thermoguttaceae bacterium]MDW8078435.1 ribosomal protein S18-alanine N-acetyltransferase [Thermoguttaceae bacterium]